MIGGRLYRCVIGVVAIGHDLSGLASQRRGAAFQCRLHLPVVDGIAGCLDVHHDSVLRVRKQLHVVAGDGAPFAVAHHVRLGIAAGGTCHERSRSCFFSCCRRSTSRTAASSRLTRFSCRTSLRRGTPSRSSPLPQLARSAIAPARAPTPVRRQLLFAPETVAARVRLDLGRPGLRVPTRSALRRSSCPAPARTDRPAPLYDRNENRTASGG